MKTHVAKPADIKRQWYVLDASKASLGRLSTQAAKLLMGKEKPNFSTHIDLGDYVIVINAAKVQISGNKLDGKMYYRHSGYPGGLTQSTLNEVMQKKPDMVVRNAVRGMLPPNKLRPGRLARLKIYQGEQHDHQAQNPTDFALGKEINK